METTAFAVAGGGVRVTRAEAERYVLAQDEASEDVDHDDIVAAFQALYDRAPDDGDGDDGAAWSLCCAAVRS